MIKFCHIAPTQYLSRLTSSNGAHLLLAHLIEGSQDYLRYYQALDDGKPRILDNSAFELFKQGRDMYSIDRLMELAALVDADYIVMPDYPNEPGQKTVDAAEESIGAIRSEGFKAFFVPQSKERDLKDYLKTFEWGLQNQDIDLIGVSIIGAPNALGVLKNKGQRILSRWYILNILEESGVLGPPARYPHYDRRRLHFLGMLDGPREILLMGKYSSYINSWDSSGPAWFGLNGGLYDESPTGQEGGKLDLDVDFGYHVEDERCTKYAKRNISYVSELLDCVGAFG